MSKKFPFRRSQPTAQLRLGTIPKLGLAMVAVAALVALWWSLQQAEEGAAAEAFDLAHARKVTLPFLNKYGIDSLKDEGKVSREQDGAVFDGVGLDDQG